MKLNKRFLKLFIFVFAAAAAAVHFGKYKQCSLAFCFNCIGKRTIYNKIENKAEVLQTMKQNSKFTVFLAVVSALAAVAAAAVAAALYFEKKRKDEEELEHYLDCSIQ